MRKVALLSLIALTAGAPVLAQTAAPATAPPPTPATPAPAAAPAPAPAGTTAPAPGATTAPTPAPTADASAPAAAPAATTPATDTAAAAPPAPPPPPSPPTDPTAIEVLTILQKLCIPAANGGDFNALAKAQGLRKSGDTGWVLKTRDYTLTVENPGSNPSQCHVDLTHPVDLDSPGKPIIIALNDWAGITNGWSLYRNDKNVQGGVQYTTRSWQLDWNGTEQSLVFTTVRKPDGTPMKPNIDTSQLIYGVQKNG
jgi:hypothetical protein